MDITVKEGDFKKSFGAFFFIWNRPNEQCTPSFSALFCAIECQKPQNWLHLLGNRATHTHTYVWFFFLFLLQSSCLDLWHFSLGWVAQTKNVIWCNIGDSPKISAVFCSNSTALIDGKLKAKCRCLQGLHQDKRTLLLSEISSSSSVDVTFQSIFLSAYVFPLKSFIFALKSQRF